MTIPRSGGTCTSTALSETNYATRLFTAWQNGSAKPATTQRRQPATHKKQSQRNLSELQMSAWYSMLGHFHRTLHKITEQKWPAYKNYDNLAPTSLFVLQNFTMSLIFFLLCL